MADKYINIRVIVKISLHNAFNNRHFPFNMFQYEGRTLRVAINKRSENLINIRQ